MITVPHEVNETPDKHQQNAISHEKYEKYEKYGFVFINITFDDNVGQLFGVILNELKNRNM